MADYWFRPTLAGLIRFVFRIAPDAMAPLWKASNPPMLGSVSSAEMEDAHTTRAIALINTISCLLSATVLISVFLLCICCKRRKARAAVRQSDIVDGPQKESSLSISAEVSTGSSSKQKPSKSKRGKILKRSRSRKSNRRRDEASLTTAQKWRDGKREREKTEKRSAIKEASRKRKSPTIKSVDVAAKSYSGNVGQSAISTPIDDDDNYFIKESYVRQKLAPIDRAVSVIPDLLQPSWKASLTATPATPHHYEEIGTVSISDNSRTVSVQSLAESRSLRSASFRVSAEQSSGPSAFESQEHPV